MRPLWLSMRTADFAEISILGVFFSTTFFHVAQTIAGVSCAIEKEMEEKMLVKHKRKIMILFRMGKTNDVFM